MNETADEQVENLLQQEQSDTKGFFSNPDRYLWIMAFIPALDIIIEMITGQSLDNVRELLYITSGIMDFRLQKRLNVKTPKGWWILLAPVYMWKRLKINNRKLMIFWVWLGLLVSSMIFTLITESSKHDQAILDTAAEVVTDIVRRETGNNIKCLKVTFGEEVKEGYYKAKALMETGTELDVMVRVSKKGRVEVTLNLNQ